MLNDTFWTLHEALRPLGLWLANYLVHSTVLLSLACLLARMLKRYAARDLLWKFALVGALMTSTARLWGQSELQTTLTMPAVPVLISGEVIGIPGGAIDAAAPSIAATSSVAAPLPWGALLLVGLVSVWVIVGSLLLLRLAKAHRGLRRALACRVPVEMGSALKQLRVATGIPSLHVTCTEVLVSPIALGTCEICVPRGWYSLAEEEQFGMLAHEAAHLMRRDPLWLLLAHILERVFFFQPLQRSVRRGLVVEAEFLCDEWAVQQTGQPLAMARCLSRVAEWLQRTWQTPLPGSIPAMAVKSSALVTRIEELLRTDKRPRARGAGILLGASLTCLLVIFACAGPRVVSDEPGGELVAAETPTVGFLFKRAANATVRIENDRQVEFIHEGGSTRHELGDPSGRSAFQAALAMLVRESDSGSPGEGESWSSSISLEIACQQDTAYSQVLRVMQACASRDVQISDIRLSGVGSRYAIPLPTGAALSTEVPTPWIELTVVGEGWEETRKVTYGLNERLWSGEEQEEGAPLFAGGKQAQTTDLNEIRTMLAGLYRVDPASRITMDARPGTVYADVVGLMDEAILAGFTDISFVGRFE